MGIQEKSSDFHNKISQIVGSANFSVDVEKHFSISGGRKYTIIVTIDADPSKKSEIVKFEKLSKKCAAVVICRLSGINTDQTEKINQSWKEMSTVKFSDLNVFHGLKKIGSAVTTCFSKTIYPDSESNVKPPPLPVPVPVPTALRAAPTAAVGAAPAAPAPAVSAAPAPAPAAAVRAAPATIELSEVEIARNRTLLGVSIANNLSKFPTRLNIADFGVEKDKLPKWEKKDFGNETFSVHLKALGHEFSQRGDFTIAGKKEPFEGYQAVYSTALNCDALITHLESCPSYIHPEDKEKLTKMQSRAVEVAQVECHADLSRHDDLKKEYDIPDKTVIINAEIEKIVDDLKKGQPVSIPTGRHGHSINIVLHDDLLIITDKAEPKKGGRRNESEQIVYQMDKPFHKMEPSKLNEFLSNLMDPELSKDEEKAIARHGYFHKPEGMQKELNLTLLTSIPKKRQKAGNCSYTNNKAAVQSAAFAMEYKRQSERVPRDEAITLAKAYSQKVFKGVETGYRTKLYTEYVGKEGSILKKEIDMTPKEYYKTLGSLNLKMSELSSDHSAVKYDKYGTEAYSGTGAKESVQKMREAAEDHAKNSKIPLTECIIQATQEEVYDGLWLHKEGSFVLFSDDPNSKDCQLGYYTRTGDDWKFETVTLVKQGDSFEFDGVSFKTLGDLKTKHPGLSATLGLPCSLERPD